MLKIVFPDLQKFTQPLANFVDDARAIIHNNFVPTARHNGRIDSCVWSSRNFLSNDEPHEVSHL